VVLGLRSLNFELSSLYFVCVFIDPSSMSRTQSTKFKVQSTKFKDQRPKSFLVILCNRRNLRMNLRFFSGALGGQTTVSFIAGDPELPRGFF
jgi:hypothetical protein